MIDAFRAAEAISPVGEIPAPPTERVARVLSPLLPPSEGRVHGQQRTGEVTRVAEAWRTVVEAHEASERASEPITAPEAKQVLIAAGFLPDTTGAAATPNWPELLGHVGEALIRAERAMTRTEGAIHRRPGRKVREQSVRYAEWAEALAGRLRDLAGETRPE